MKLNFVILLFVISVTPLFAQTSFVINHNHTDLSQIPDNWIDSAKKNLKIIYFRRSHGSHIDVGGMAALRRYSTAYADKYDYNETGSGGALKLATQWHSVDFEPDTWYSITRSYLDDPANADINVAMWAWSSKFYISDVQAYLDTMEAFIRDYGPNGTKIQAGVRTVPVTFIFQTACSQASDAANRIVYEQNQVIRQHCADNNRILFDFNDIETYNPDGVYFGDGNPDGSYSGLKRLDDDISYNLDGGGRGNWGIEWNNAHPSSELAQLSADNICTVCEHSDQREDPNEDNSRLHCVLKGRAAWWMWAKLAGWGVRELKISVQTALTERNLNGAIIDMELSGEAFADNSLDPANFTLNNAPAGTSIASVNYVDADHASLTLSFDGSDFDTDIQNFNILISNQELVSNEDITSNDLLIESYDEKLEISPEVVLNETNLDNGVLQIHLVQVEFADNSLDAGNFSLNNAPVGTAIEAIQYIDATSAKLDLSFDGTDFDTDIPDFSLSIAGIELNSNQDMISNNLQITAVNESAPYMTLSTDVALSEANLAGAVIDLNLHNETFSDNQLSITNFELINAPVGCSIGQINYLNDSSASCVLNFDGTDFDTDIPDFSVRVLGSELSTGQNLEGDYLSIEAVIEPEGTPSAKLNVDYDLTESNLDTAHLKIILSQTVFNTRLSIQEFVLNNAPQGLTIASVSRDNDTTGILALAFDGMDFSTDIENFNVTVLASANSSNTNLITNDVSILAENVTGIKEIHGLVSVVLFPNPNEGKFQLAFNLSDAKDLLIEVIDISGKIVYSKQHVAHNGKNTLNIDIPKIKQGVKILQLTIAGKQVIIPFVIN